MAKGTNIQAQPDGMPQGRHITYSKSSKAGDKGTCMCGGCHPNAQAAKDKTIYANKRS